MPIPPYDAILNILPPHLGDPRLPDHLSPYACTIDEVCDRFATSQRRVEILNGLLDLRAELRALGIGGFQWLGGSFVEDIEAQENRDPGDVDAVTFASEPANLADLNTAIRPKPDLLNPVATKAQYHVDHYLVPLSSAAELIVDHTRYWCSLFSHRRDREWKGMLVAQLPLGGDDDAARIALKAKP